MPDPPGGPGWYRLTDAGWEPVDGDQAQAEPAAPGSEDLVFFEAVTPDADPLS